jgi:hypothetical protein
VRKERKGRGESVLNSICSISSRYRVLCFKRRTPKSTLILVVCHIKDPHFSRRRVFKSRPNARHVLHRNVWRIKKSPLSKLCGSTAQLRAEEGHPTSMCFVTSPFGLIKCKPWCSKGVRERERERRRAFSIPRAVSRGATRVVNSDQEKPKRTLAPVAGFVATSMRRIRTSFSLQSARLQ